MVERPSAMVECITSVAWRAGVVLKLTPFEMEGVRRCRDRYVCERGSSGLLGVVADERAATLVKECERVEKGEVEAETAGERWCGGV